MNIIVVVSTGNDIDIIESNIHHNMQYFSKMVIVDNNSEDGTVEILKELKEEYGNRLELNLLSTCSLETYSFETNAAIARHRDIADYLLVIDADEFLIVKDINELLNIKESMVGYIQWKTYIPNKLNHKNYIKEMTHRRDSEPEGCHKVIIPSKTAGYTTLGNHYLHDAFHTRIPGIFMKKIWLAHFPVRTLLQVNKKIDFITKLFENFPVDQCYHNRNVPKITNLPELIEKALNYAIIDKTIIYSEVYEPL
jgi:glycosyltransferase involved in cell wall biosynthesis